MLLRSNLIMIRLNLRPHCKGAVLDGVRQNHIITGHCTQKKLCFKILILLFLFNSQKIQQNFLAETGLVRVL